MLRLLVRFNASPFLLLVNHTTSFFDWSAPWPTISSVTMRSAPIELELLYFLISEAIQLELAPRVQAALVAEREIAGFADFAFRRFLVEAAVRDAEDLARGDAVRLIPRILRRVIAPIGIELPFLAGDPGQHPRFN